MKKLLPLFCYSVLFLAGLFISQISYSQMADFSKSEVLFYENFDVDIPDDFIVLDRDSGVPHSDYFYPQDTAWLWNKTDDGGRIYVITYFDQYIPADDWIILPGITIEDSAYLYWEALSADSEYPETYEVLVSTTEPDPDAFNPAAFNLLTIIGAENPEMTAHSLNLDDEGYANQEVWIAFHAISLDAWKLYMDNFYVCVPHVKDLKSVDCNANASLVPGNPVIINYKITNIGVPCSTLKVCWKEEGNPAIHEMTLPGNSFGETQTGSFADQFVSSTTGETSIKVWVDEVDGNPDTDPSNDTSVIYVEYVDEPVSRNILVEEFTGTWCQYCPDGARYIDTLVKYHPDVIPVAIHGSDLMTIPETNDIIKFACDGYPSATMNRLFWEQNFAQGRYSWNNYLSYVMNDVPVSVGITAYSEYDSTNGIISAQVTADFTRSKHGNFRFNLYVVEDSVTGYPQKNYYNNDSTSPFYGLGNPINDYVHKHVLRKMVGGTWGEQGSLTNPASGEYSHTFAFLADPSWDMYHVELVATISEYNSCELQRTIINSTITELFPMSLYTLTDELITDDSIIIAAKSTVSEKEYAFKVKNNTIIPLDAKMKIEKLSGNRDHTQYICWDNCYPGDVLETETVTVGADTFSIFSASLHVEPDSLTGTDEYLVTVYDTANPEIKKELHLTYIFSYYTGIEVSESDASVRGTVVFPNPSDGLVNVRFTGKEAASAAMRISVMNALGQVVYLHEDFTDQTGSWTGTLDMSNLPEGIYYYTTETSQVKETGKFIISR